MLRAARVRVGVTQRAMCRDCGLSSNYVGKLENGMRVPSRAAAERMADFLGLDDAERGRLLAASVTDAGLNHPWRTGRMVPPKVHP